MRTTMVDVIYRKCYICGKVKELNVDNFPKNKTKKDGFTFECKECKKVKDKEYYEKNKEYVKQRVKIYSNDNKEKIYLWHKEYAKKHKIEIQEREKQWRKNNKEYINNKNRQVYNGITFGNLHRKTRYNLKKYGLIPTTCSICNKECNVIAHHPDNNKWYEIVFCCRKCHSNIHSGNIKCPNPINIFKLIN